MKTVLIIDNDPDFCQAAAILLEPLHVGVTMSGNGEDGRAKAERLQPDLIILSAELPDTSGYKVCKLLRAAVLASKIILVSAKDDHRVFDRHSKLGYSADVYLPKPIDESDLVDAVTSLLGTLENFPGFANPVDDMELESWFEEPDEEEPGDDAPVSEAAAAVAAAPAGDQKLQEIISNQERELEYLRKEVSAFNSFMAQAEKTENALRDTRAQLATSETLLAELEKQEGNAEISNLMAQINELEKALENAEARRESLAEQRKKLEWDNTRLQENLEAVQEQLNMSENSLGDMKVQFKKAERISEGQSLDAENDQMHIETLQDQVQVLSARLEESKNLADERDSELMEARLEMSALEEDKENLQASLSEEQEQGRHFRRRVSELEQELNALGAEKNKYRLEKEQMERQLGEARDSFEDGQKRLADHKTANREKESALEGELAKARNRADELQDTVNNLKLSGERNTAGLADLTERLKARENELERALQNKQRLELDLNETRNELSRFLENKGEEARSVERKLAEFSDKANAAEEKQISLEKDLKHVRRENQELSGKVSAKDSELEGLRADVERTRSDLESERQTHQRLLARSQEAENQFRSDAAMFQTQKDELNNRIDALSMQLKQTKAEHDENLRKANQEAAAQQETLATEKYKLEQQAEANRSRIHELEDSLKSLEKKLDAREMQHRDQLAEQKNAAEKNYTRLEQDKEEERLKALEELARQQTAFKAALANLESDKVDLSAANSSLEQRLAAKDAEMRKAQELSGERVAELEHARETLNRTILKEREGREGAETRIKTLEERIAATSREHEKTIGEMRKSHQEQVDELHRKTMSLQSRVDQLERDLEKHQELVARHEKMELEQVALKMGCETLKSRMERARNALEIVVKELNGSRDERGDGDEKN